MREISFRNNTMLGDGHEPYIVAEVNTSHNGSLDMAKRMIETAKQVGCDCVKFQSWSSQSLYSKTYYKENPIAERFVKKFSFTKDQQLELSKYCKESGIAFASTPYSKEEVDFLVEQCEVPYIKVASMDLNNDPFLEYIADKQVPIVLATGMADMEEIRNAVRIIEAAGNSNLCILHCISIYPPEISSIRLKNIVGLQKEFPKYPIGFSDHSIGTEMASAAIALGAALIEKHFTMDKSKVGMDNQMATEPEEMKMLVSQCHNVYKGLGDDQRIVSDEEQEQRLKMRRSVVSTKEIKCGETIQREDLDVKRPGIGFRPDQMDEIVGKKAARDIRQDMIIMADDLEDVDL